MIKELASQAELELISYQGNGIIYDIVCANEGPNKVINNMARETILGVPKNRGALGRAMFKHPSRPLGAGVELQHRCRRRCLEEGPKDECKYIHDITSLQVHIIYIYMYCACSAFSFV